MPYPATIFNVLIASPSDVAEERKAIAESLHEWNALHSQERSQALMPVMWETHGAAAMGDRPQGILNRQLVRGCDMLIGAFWTRLGSPTGVEESGSVEEIKWFLDQKKPVMLYYSRQRPNLDDLDFEQAQKLKDFKKSIRNQGIQFDYETIPDLKKLLSNQLTIVMRDMKLGPLVDSDLVKAANQSAKDTVSQRDSERPQPAKAPRSRKTDSTLRLVEYSEKSFVVVGNSEAHRDALLAEGGKWISLRFGGKGWMFAKRRLGNVAAILDLSTDLSPAPDSE
ncbi:hypothetical protein [Burkholderia gladioli]|uniref:hypothetical protein n=1 Tax=Burkholderia gladioli TaxID=28095 RepID=UPI00163FC7D3|nr:hypothetical protein [Burkholderia gladioli]